MTVTVHNELRLLDRGAPLPSGSHSQDTRRRDFTLPAVTFGEGMASAAAADNKLRIYHQRAANGDRISLGFLSLTPNGPTDRIYGFRNGRLQFIVSHKFAKRGNRWRRESSRLTSFDSGGTPIAQMDSRTEDDANPSNARSGKGTFVAEATGFPANAIDESRQVDYDSGGYACMSEFLDVMSKYATLFAAMAATKFAWDKCALTGGAVCSAALSAGAAVFAAFLAYNTALEKLTACEFADWLRKTNGAGGGSSGGSNTPTPGGSSSGSLDPIKKFIEDSESAGNVWCDRERTDCVYYAAA